MDENLKLVDRSMLDKGVFVFENGNYLFIEEIQYSYDGTFWENQFKADSHRDPRDITQTIPGHRYRRVRHAGEDYFQEPEYIVAEDGKNAYVALIDNKLYSFNEGDAKEDYVELLDINTLEGPKGSKGDTGEGWKIDRVGYYLEKPDCTLDLNSTSTCGSCSSGTSSVRSSNYALFLSLGDGLHEIEAGDVGSYYSKDGVTWIEIVATDAGKQVRYIANDAVGTGSVDYRNMDDLGTKGKVYICADGRWQEFMSVAIPRHKMSPTEQYYSDNQEGYYMEDYIGVPYATDPTDGHTLALYNDTGSFEVRVKENSITPKHLKDGIFDDGFEEGAAGPEGYKSSNILINVSDFSGYGLQGYTSDNDGYDDLQVDPRDFAHDGLISESIGSSDDGEVPYKLRVDVEDIVDETQSGLTTFSNTDSYRDIAVKLITGSGLDINSDGLFVEVDDLSLAIDGNALEIKTYVAGNDGVLASHLNPSTANSNRGIILSNSTGLEVSLTTDHNPFDFDSSGGLRVVNEGIEGWHLNSNIASIDSGLLMNTTTDSLEVKLKTGGGLKVDNDGMYIDAANLTWLSSYMITSIGVGLAELQGDVTFDTPNTDPYVNVVITNTGNSIEFDVDTDVSALNNLIDTRVGNVASADHVHSISDVTDLGTQLDSKVDEDLEIGNIKIVTGVNAGLHIKDQVSGNWGRLVIDGNYNLGVEPVA